MNRRNAILAPLALGAAGLPVGAAAQTGKVFRIGGVATNEDVSKPYYEALMAGMRELGYVSGRNLVVDRRFTNDDNSRMPALVSELIAQQPDVLVGTEAHAVEMRKQTATIPIVVLLSVDPVRAGLVQSLGRPGTNVTGTYAGYELLVGKHIEILTDLLPGISRVAFFNDQLPLSPGAPYEQMAVAAAAAKRITLSVVRASDPDGVVKAFAALEMERPEALVVPATLTTIRLRNEILAQARRLRLPAISAVTGPLWADAGGLIFYGPNVVAGWRAGAGYVDKILKGAKPADLPLQQPNLELVINLKTAKALGVKIPESILIRAERVIE